MPKVALAAYNKGTENVRQLGGSLTKAWAASLANPKEKEEIASLLDVPASALAGKAPPIEIKTDRSGITGLEGALLVLAADWLTDIFAGAAKDLAKEAVEDAAKKIWTKYLRPKLKREAIGKEHKPAKHRKK